MKEDDNGYKRLFNGFTPKAAKPEPEPEDDDDVGPCAAIPKSKIVTALTVRHAGEPWESFTYTHLAIRHTYTPTRFEVEFCSHDERYKVVVTGRNLGKIYAIVLQHRCEWIRADPRGEFAADDEPVITKIAVVKVEEKRG